MHDPFLKSVFADRRVVEILIRDHVPEWADEIDFSTLREESTGLVSKKTFQRRQSRHDLVRRHRQWPKVVLFLMEFQRKVERLMALRTTTYSALTLEGIAARTTREIAPGVGLPRSTGDRP